MEVAHCNGARHQQGSFHETESSQTSLKHAIADMHIGYLLFHFKFQQNKPIGLFSDTVYEYALNSTFRLKTQKIGRLKFVNCQVKILSF